VSKSREQINQFLSTIDITDKAVLDVGVQNNPASNYTKGVAKKYLTMDVDDEWKPDLVADLNYRLPTFELTGLHDIVFCLEVLEHCWHPVEAVKNLAGFTKEGGVCYISVPFINPIHDKWDFLRYTDEWFKVVLPKVGFKEVRIHYRMATEGFEILKAFYQSEGLRMSKIRQGMGDGNKLALIGLIVEARK